MAAQDLCAACRSPAVEVCNRCASPVCAEHAPGFGLRCAACELDHLERGSSKESRVIRMMGLVLVGVFTTGFVMALTGGEMFWLPGVVGLIAVSVGLSSPRIARRMFLKERRTPQPQLAETNHPGDD